MLSFCASVQVRQALHSETLRRVAIKIVHIRQLRKARAHKAHAHEARARSPQMRWSDATAPGSAARCGVEAWQLERQRGATSAALRTVATRFRCLIATAA
eukprot:6206028-Pleurochrysis_carterae.AAC.3